MFSACSLDDLILPRGCHNRTGGAAAFAAQSRAGYFCLLVLLLLYQHFCKVLVYKLLVPDFIAFGFAQLFGFKPSAT